MSNIQYYHGNKVKRQFTVMVDVKNIKDYEYNVNIGTEFNFWVGFAQVSKGDQYNKKIGRNISSGRAELVTFEIVQAEYLDNKTVALLFRRVSDNSLVKNLLIHVNPNWKKPHLIHATI